MGPFSTVSRRSRLDTTSLDEMHALVIRLVVGWGYLNFRLGSLLGQDANARTYNCPEMLQSEDG